MSHVIRMTGNGISLTSLSLITSIKCEPEDFMIVNCDREYECHFAVIAASCSRVASLTTNGKHPPKMMLSSSRPLLELKNVINHFYGEPIVITLSNCAELRIIADALGAQSLLEKVSPIDAFQKALFQYLCLLQQGNDGPEILAALATYFEVLRYFNKARYLPPELKMRILTNEHLKVVSEDHILFWILSLTDIDGLYDCMSYLDTLNYQNLSPKGWSSLFASDIPLSCESRSKMMTEFIKDPRSRKADLTGERYWPSAEDLHSAIINRGRTLCTEWLKFTDYCLDQRVIYHSQGSLSDNQEPSQGHNRESSPASLH